MRKLTLLIALFVLFAGAPIAAQAAPLFATLLNVVDSSGDAGQYSSLELDASGNPVISYFDTANRQLMLAHCSDPNCSGPVSIETVDSSLDAGWYTSLVLDAAGNPVISYFHHDGTKGVLKLAHCSDINCSGPISIEIVDDPGGLNNVGQHTSLKLNVNGFPVVAYHDETNQGLKLALCGDPNCDSGTAAINIIALDDDPNPLADVGAATSLVINGAGLPLVSYWDSGNSDLKLAFCNDAACSTFGTTVVDNIHSVMGNSTSLALDSSGFPVISYQGTSNLMLAHCGDAFCNTNPIILNLVDFSVTPLYQSMALDPNDNAVIAYGDNSNSLLKLAYCDDPDCASATLSTLDATTSYYVSLELGCSNTPVVSYYDLSTQVLKLASDDQCALPSATTPSTTSGPKINTNIASTGTTSLGLGRRIIVYVPADAIPPGLTDCTLAIREQKDAKADFDLDDTAWDVTIICAGTEVHIFYAPITVCIRPLDGVLSDKQVFHRHGTGGFQAIFGGDEIGPASFVCGQTRLLSLFTLGQLRLPTTGFVPGQTTELSAQPAEFAYAASDLLLSIPKLGVELDIVGVPRSPTGWDVSWLSSEQAGYLYGTAFPTWAGNSVLTAHVWNADNSAGPFYALKDLQHGDRFTISAYGYTYTYEVRNSQLVTPNRLSVLQDSEYSQITLLTCESFNEARASYRYRRAVQAVLVQVD